MSNASLSLSLTHTHTLYFSPSLFLCLKHTYTHTQSTTLFLVTDLKEAAWKIQRFLSHSFTTHTDEKHLIFGTFQTHDYLRFNLLWHNNDVVHKLCKTLSFSQSYHSILCSTVYVELKSTMYAHVYYKEKKLIIFYLH